MVVNGLKSHVIRQHKENRFNVWLVKIPQSEQLIVLSFLLLIPGKIAAGDEKMSSMIKYCALKNVLLALFVILAAKNKDGDQKNT